MIRSPDDREDRGGRQEAARLRTMEMAARAAITRSVLAGGMMTAINIPYSATPRAFRILADRSSPDTAPKKVPAVQPGMAIA